MRLSDDKIRHLSHLILNKLSGNPSSVFLESEEQVLRKIKQAIHRELSLEEEVDQFVRKKLSSYGRPLPEGSPEWNVLYQKFFAEESNKKNR